MTMSIAVAGCAQTSAAPAPSPIPLLTKQETTVLDQPIAYPTQLPAQVSSTIITLAPGAQTGWHRHEAPMYAYIMSGVLNVEYEGGITKIYRTGESIMEALGTYHNGSNHGFENVKILVVNMGAEGVANTEMKP